MINNFSSCHHWRPSRLYWILGLKFPQWKLTYHLFSVEVDRHSMFASCNHGFSFGVFFCSNRNFMAAWISILENFILSVYMILSMIWNRFKNKLKLVLNNKKKSTLSSYSDKIMLRKWVGPRTFYHPLPFKETTTLKR